VIQQSQKYELDFYHAFRVYTTKYTGPIVVGFIVILIAMFVVPDIVAAAAGGRYSTIAKNILSSLRAYSIALGIVSQSAGFLIVRRGDKYMRDAETQLLKGKQNGDQPQP